MADVPEREAMSGVVDVTAMMEGLEEKEGLTIGLGGLHAMQHGNEISAATTATGRTNLMVDDDGESE